MRVLASLAKFADQYKALPTLGFTHYQAAQLVTVGKRATLWMNELLSDLEEVEYRLDHLKLLGCKGTTGTQASFLELFAGDQEKVRQLDRKIAVEMGFGPDQVRSPLPARPTAGRWTRPSWPPCPASPSRPISLPPTCGCWRHMKEIEEPFEKHQVGSSAMPYKRNPWQEARLTNGGCARTRRS